MLFRSAIYNRKFAVIPVAVLLLYIYIHDWVMKKNKAIYIVDLTMLINNMQGRYQNEKA